MTTQWVSSQSETKAVLELGDLIRLQTANPAYTLRRLALCELQLKQNDAPRSHLLETARMAVQVAHGEFNRASHAAQRRACKREGAAFDPAPTIQFADATDLQSFADAARIMADALDNGMSNFAVFRGPSQYFKHAVAGLKAVVESLARGGAEAEMMEIRWAVERKCMYLDSVAMMDARIGEVGHVEGASRRLRRHSG